MWYNDIKRGDKMFTASTAVYREGLVSTDYARRIMGLATWDIGLTTTAYYPEDSPIYVSPIPCRYCKMQLENNRCIACGGPQDE